MVSPEATDRAAGALSGGACGDVLGVPYEFGAPLSGIRTPEMIGGGLGPHALGEHSDDTRMAVCVAEALRDHEDPCSPETLGQTTRAFSAWMREGAFEIGAQTGRILRGSDRGLTRSDAGAAETMLHHSRSVPGGGARSARLPRRRPRWTRLGDRAAARGSSRRRPHPVPGVS
ncbi:ADP-ribosylglycohydrolase family protein [Nocardiopsis alkaliphila]|uniref:ADP-ribosylglycohydrolase family protein n=1 Tax=Nocardiopsis alkaliphila TaxID=225762 RepID=UPI00034CD26E|nr:ADP-ribosylglycohydrolase family protein [Nocardiopsis alkaliphila]